MYKITTVEQINQINEAQSKKEIGSKYCEHIRHPLQELYAIPVLDTVLRSYQLEFITDEWLSTDVYETLPDDWNWVYENESVRITIPNYLILTNTNLRNLITYSIDNDVKNVIDKEYTRLYVNYILPEHLALLESITEITIETRN